MRQILAHRVKDNEPVMIEMEDLGRKSDGDWVSTYKFPDGARERTVISTYPNALFVRASDNAPGDRFQFDAAVMRAVGIELAGCKVIE